MKGLGIPSTRFDIKGSFDRLIILFVQKIVPFANVKFGRNVSKIYSHVQLESDDTLFENFPDALEAIDVTFQHSNRPSGNLQEGKFYFSGKHHLSMFTLLASRPLTIFIFRDQSQT